MQQLRLRVIGLDTLFLGSKLQKTEIRGIFSASSQQKHLVDAVNFLFVVAGYILRHSH